MVLPMPPGQMPGGDPAMGAGPAPDPTGGMAEEVMLMAEDVRRAIEEQVSLLTQPVYPPWYDENDYPEPDDDKAIAKIRQLQAEFAPLRNRIADDILVATNVKSGRFKDYVQDQDLAWKDSGIAGEIEIIASQLADTELAFDAPARKISHEDEAAKKVDFALACKQDAARQHSISGNGPLAFDIARMLLVTGRLCWHVDINPDADEDDMPFIEHLVDPSTCMPVFEKNRGLRLMGRAYTTTVGEAIGTFETVENELSRLLDDRGKDGKFKKARSEEESCEIVEWVDRRWRLVFLDGEKIIEAEHAYGFVPYVYKMGGLGLPATLRDPARATEQDKYNIEYTTQWRARDAAMPNKGISLIGLLRVPHALREAVMTKMLTEWDKSFEPPMGVELDDISYKDGVPEIGWGKGEVSPFKMGRQKPFPLIGGGDPGLQGPILQGVADNGSRLMLPATAHGQNDKSNVAGYATNMLNEAGLTKTVWAKQTIAEFERECMEMRLRLFRDWGHLVTQGANGANGALLVPKSDPLPNEDRTFELTPGDLRRTGIKMQVQFSSLPVQMIGPVANALSILKNAGWIDDMRALKILQDPNPHKTLQRIKLDKMLNDPVIIEMEGIEALVENGMEGKAAYFMARKMGEKAAAGGGANGGIPGGGGGAPVGTTVGDSNAQYGQGPGAGSGPQGPLPPPSMIGTEP